MYDFETRINRKNTGALKWELMYREKPDVSPHVLPLSTADMEFINAPEVRQGLQEYLEDSILGYQTSYDSFKESIVDWQSHRYNWKVKEDWLVETNSVVTAIYAAVRTFTEENDGIIIFRPSYPPFGNAINLNNRIEINVPLINEDGYYRIDFEQFEKVAEHPKNKMLILCNPHNPVGRVWTKEELERIATISLKHNLIVVADEIWRDIIMPGHEFTPLAKVNDQLSRRLITCTSTSKTFNLAGLKLATIIIQDKNLRSTFQKELDFMHGRVIGSLAYKGVELAYTRAEPWLDEVIKVIHTNQKLVHEFFNKYAPKIKAPKIEGTYVQWVDMSELGMTDKERAKWLEQKADIFCGHGTDYGFEEGSGFERINLALPTNILLETLERLLEALEKNDIL